jgi:hypothetical protein
MIKFTNPEKRQYVLTQTDSEGNEKIIHKYNLIYNPGSNKYDILFKFIEDMCNTLGPECEEWYIKFITDYLEKQDFQIIQNNVPFIKKYCDEFLKIININFEGYVDKSKASKSSIFFDDKEIKEIVKTSSYLKVYYTLYKDMNTDIPQRFNNKIFQQLVANIVNSPIILKLHKIVSSKTFEYNSSDRFMWQYIHNMLCRTPDIHITSIFNFVVNYIIVTCETDKNPIPYLISVIDESIKWILRTTYRDSIVYSDSISTQDVNNVSGRDNLKTYAYNNTIGQLCVISYDALDQMFGENEQKDAKIEEFKAKIESITELSVISECITYPILSKILDIPFRHFQTLSISTSYMLNILLYNLMEGTIFDTKYSTIKRLLLYHNTHKPIVKTSYKIKNLNKFFETFDHFLGFKNKTSVYQIYSSLIGKIVKNEYVDFITGNPISNLPIQQIETSIIDFYNKYFSGKLDDEFEKIRQKIDIRC